MTTAIRCRIGLVVLACLVFSPQVYALQETSSSTNSFSLKPSDFEDLPASGLVEGTYVSISFPEVCVTFSGSIYRSSLQDLFYVQNDTVGTVAYTVGTSGSGGSQLASVRAGHRPLINTPNEDSDGVTFGDGFGYAIAEFLPGDLNSGFNGSTDGATGTVTKDEGTFSDNGDAGPENLLWRPENVLTSGSVDFFSSAPHENRIVLFLDFIPGFSQTLASALANCGCAKDETTPPGGATGATTWSIISPPSGGSGCSTGGCGGSASSGGSNSLFLNMTCAPGSESMGGSVGDGCFTNYDYILKFYRLCGEETSAGEPKHEYMAVLFDPCSGGAHKFRSTDNGEAATAAVFNPVGGSDYAQFTVTNLGESGMEDLTDAHAKISRDDGYQFDFDIKNTTDDEASSFYPARLSTITEGSVGGQSNARKVQFNYGLETEGMEQLKVDTFIDPYGVKGTVFSTYRSGRYVWDRVEISGHQNPDGEVALGGVGGPVERLLGLSHLLNPSQLMSLSLVPVLNNAGAVTIDFGGGTDVTRSFEGGAPLGVVNLISGISDDGRNNPTLSWVKKTGVGGGSEAGEIAYTADYDVSGDSVAQQYAGFVYQKKNGADQVTTTILPSLDGGIWDGSYDIVHNGVAMNWVPGHSLKYGDENYYSMNVADTVSEIMLGQPAIKTDSTGYSTGRTYDDNGNLKREIHPVYDASGDVVVGQNTYELTLYDDNNLIIYSRDREGYVMIYERDDEGRLLRRITGLKDDDDDDDDFDLANGVGFTPPVGAQPLQTIYHYYPDDAANGAGLVQWMVAGVPYAEGDSIPDGDVLKLKRTDYAYNGQNRLETRTLPLPLRADEGEGEASRPTVTYEWNGARLRSLTDERGFKRVYAYDNLDRLVCTDYMSGDEQISFGDEQVWYDDANRKVYRKDRNGLVSLTEYDAAWRRKTVYSAYGTATGIVGGISDLVPLPVHLQSKVTYGYKVGESRTSTMTRNGHETVYDYDYRGRNILTSRIPRFGVARNTNRIYKNNMLFATTESFRNGEDSFVQGTYRGYSPDRQMLRVIRAKTPYLGDLDGNGVVDFLDIAPFIAALNSGYLAAADMDQSGVVDFLDIGPFITLLSGLGTLQAGLAFPDEAAVMSAMRIAPEVVDRNFEIVDAVRDLRGNTVLVTDEYGSETLSKFDEHGRNYETTIAYQPSNITTKTVYNERGQVFQSIDAAGVITEYEYDDADNVKKMTLGKGATDESGSLLELVTNYRYDPDGLQSETVSPSNLTSTIDRKDCCGRSRGQRQKFIAEDETTVEQGSITNMDYGGRTVHTAIVKDFDTGTNFLDPSTEQTLSETTTRYYGNGQVQFRTIWKEPLVGDIDVNGEIPIAFDNTKGVTTQYLYDSCIGDGLGLDGSGVTAVSHTGGADSQINIDEALTRLALPITDDADGGAGISFSANHSGSASVVIAPDERTMQVSISDGMGRRVMSALLHGPKATAADLNGAAVGGLIDYSLVLHDQVLGKMQAVTTIDSAGETTKSFSDDLGHQRGSIDELGYTTTRLNGPKGEPRIVTDARSNQTEYRYDILGRQIEMEDAEGHLSKTEYDAAGRVELQYDSKDKFTQTQYDGLGRVWKTTDRSTINTTTRSYDDAGRLHKLTDAEDKVTTYGYDPLGQRTLVTMDDTTATLMKYDAAGRVTYSEQASGRNQTTTYLLSGVRRKTEYRAADGSLTGTDSFTEDEFLRPTGGTSLDSVTTVRTYTNRGQVESETTTIDNKDYPVTYTYDKRGRLARVEYPSGKIAAYTFDERSSLDTIEWNSNEISDRGYNEIGALVSNTRPQVVESRIYNSLNLLTQIDNPGVVKADYTYDGNRNKLTETFDGVMASHSFTTVSGPDEGYDAEDRLMRFDQTFDQTGNNVTFSRSGIGNISTATLNGTPSTRVYSPLHELENTGSQTLQVFDDDGNMTKMASGTNLIWNAAGRLKSASLSGPSFHGNISYGHSIDGRRSYQVKQGNGGFSVNIYIYAGPNCIAEYALGQPTGSPEVEFVYGQGIDSLALIDTGNEELSVLRNQQWSVTALVNNANGAVVERYAYDHFGKRTILDAAGNDAGAASNYKNPYGYTSRRHEDETGLMYFRARYYDASTGEFISRDPLEYVDGMSLYRGYFVPSGVDPFGLEEATMCELWWHYLTWQNAGQPSVDTLDTVLDGAKRTSQVVGGGAALAAGAIVAAPAIASSGPAIVGTTTRVAGGVRNLGSLARVNPGAAIGRVASTPGVTEGGIGLTGGMLGMDGPPGLDDLGSGLVKNLDDFGELIGKSGDEVGDLLRCCKAPNRPPNLSPEGAGRRGAFREAKRQNGIPTGQQPSSVKPNVDRRNRPQPGRQYEFDTPDGKKTIRDDAGGHSYPDDPTQNRGPHFNDDAGNHYDY